VCELGLSAWFGLGFSCSSLALTLFVLTPFPLVSFSF
jgi:hypothetical protein